MGVSSSAPLSAGVGVTVKERYHAYLPKQVNRHAVLTDEKVKLVHDHWNFIADERDAGMVDSRSATRQSRISVFYDAFYDKLFDKAPTTRSLFDGNMVRQSRALVKMVSWLCNLEATEDLVNRLEALADRHVGYGCLPMHYEAGGIALQHALRAATEDQDPAQMEIVMKAWDDLYSFVVLIVIPRTALRLEESIRSAGPVSTMLRSTPISGTRLKVQTTPPPNWNTRGEGRHRDGGGGGLVGCPQPGFGTPHTAAGTPSTADGEWFGGPATAAAAAAAVGSSRRTDGGTVLSRTPIVRSGSGSFTRSIAGRRRSNSSHRGAAGSGSGSGGHTPDSEAHGGCPGGRRGVGLVKGSGGGGSAHTLGTPCSGQDGGYTPGDSPSSITSSMASGLQLSVAGSVATSTGFDSVCASPDGSTVSSNARTKVEGGRRLKLLRGLGKLAGGGGGTSSSPKATIWSRARGVSNRSRQNGGTGDGENGKSIRGRRASSVGSAAPVPIRRAHARGSSVPPERAVASAPVGVSAAAVDAARDMSIAPADRAYGHSADGDSGKESSCGSHRSSSRSGSVATKRGRPATSDTPPPLPSPAHSAVSLPSGRSWEQSSMLTGLRGSVSSRRLSARTAVAPTSESPSAVFLAPPDFNWAGDGRFAGGRARSHRISRSTGARDTPIGVGGGKEMNDYGESTGSGMDMSPHDQKASSVRSLRRGTTGIAKAGNRSVEGKGRTEKSPVPGAARLQESPPTAPVEAQRPASKMVEPLQLPESSTARMESVSFNRNGVLGGGAAGRGRSPKSGSDSAERKHGVRERGGLERGSPPRAPLALAGGGLSNWKEDEAEPLTLPVTPTVDGVRLMRTQLSSPSPTETYSGSRRTGRRVSAGSRRSHGGGSGDRDPRLAAKAESNLPEGKGRNSDGRTDYSRSSEDEKPKLSPPRTISREAAALWGFLGGNSPPDQRNWSKRPGSSSGGEFDQIGANALAYREAREKEKQQRNRKKTGPAARVSGAEAAAAAAGAIAAELEGVGNGVGKKEGVRMLPTRQQQQQQQQKRPQETNKNRAEEEKMPESISTPRARRSNLMNGKHNSPTPEELAAVEAEASKARQRERHLAGESAARGPPAVDVPPSPSHVKSTLPQKHTLASQAPRLPPHRAQSAGSPSLCSSPFFASAASSVGDGVGTGSCGDSSGGRGSGDLGDEGRGRNGDPFASHWPYIPRAIADETPPMWKPRRSITSSTTMSPCASPPTDDCKGFLGAALGANSAPGSGRGRPPPYNTPPASPPPPFAKHVPTRSPRAVEAAELIRGGMCQVGSSLVAKDTSSAASTDDRDSALNQARDYSSDGTAVTTAEAATSAPPVQPQLQPPPQTQPARGVRLAVEPPPDLFGPHSPLQLRPIPPPTQLPTRPQQQPQQQQTLKKSNKRPMSLPPADGSGDTPEPDHFGGSTPAATAAATSKKPAVDSGRSGGRERCRSVGGDSDCIFEAPSPSEEARPRIHSRRRVSHGRSRPMTPGTGIGDGHALPRRLRSLTSLWSDSDLSKGSEEEDIESDFSLEEGPPSEPVVASCPGRHVKVMLVETNGDTPRAAAAAAVVAATAAASTAAAATAAAAAAGISVSAADSPVPAMVPQTEKGGQRTWREAGGIVAPRADTDAATSQESAFKPTMEKPASAVTLNYRSGGGTGKPTTLKRWRRISSGGSEDQEIPAAAAAAAAAVAAALLGKEGGHSATAAGAVESGGAPVAGTSQGKAAAEEGKGGNPAAAAASMTRGETTATERVAGPNVQNRVNGMVVALNSAASFNKLVGGASDEAAAAAAAAAPPPPPQRLSLVRPAPSSGGFVAQMAKPRGRVAAMAASYTAGKGGRGDVADGVGESVGGGGSGRHLLKTRKDTVRRGDGGSGDGSASNGSSGAGVEREGGSGDGGEVQRTGPIEGLARGHVREKASAWGKAWRS